MKKIVPRSLLPLLIVIATAGIPSPPARAQQAAASTAPFASELAALQGTWVVTAAEMGGKPFDDIVGGRLAIDSTRFMLVTATGNKLAGQITIDASHTPRQLDFKLDAGAVWLAIYSVSGKTLRLNYVEAADGDKRPTGFATSSELHGTVIALRKDN